MMLGYVLQIQLSRERTLNFYNLVFSVILSGAQTPSTENKSKYEYEKSFITLGSEYLPLCENTPISLIIIHEGIKYVVVNRKSDLYGLKIN